MFNSLKKCFLFSASQNDLNNRLQNAIIEIQYYLKNKKWHEASGVQLVEVDLFTT